MARIKVLSKQVSELIAAGEVVERPASAVKELMENAIDAGAESVSVEIKNGGITYIRVTDNGCGIERDDVATAFISHATSKISSEDDLNAIHTLGFRGEALASIAAVSHTEVLTKTEHEQTGTRYCITAGEQTLIDDAGCPQGTTIVVRDLFFNTPARMKFLKKDVTEANAVAGVVDRIALSNPDVSIRFIREGKNVLFTSGSGDLKTAAFEIFGKDFSDGLIEAEYEYESVKVSGLISKPSNCRPNRNMQFFFVNGRLVKTGTASAALSEAYKNSVMVGKFPYCVLNIDTSPELVDVNVHPAKTEVRFANERSVFSAVYYAAKNALEHKDAPPKVNIPKRQDTSLFAPPAPKAEQLKMQESIPQKRSDFWVSTSASDYRSAVDTKKTESEIHAKADNKPVFEPKQPQQKVHIDIVESPKASIPSDADEPSTIQHFLDSYKAQKSDDTVQPAQKPEAEISDTEPQPAEDRIIEKDEEIKTSDDEKIEVVGEAFKTYIIVQKGESLFLVDKHAAHERMLFNKLLNSADNLNTQVLLSPITVTLSKEEYSAVLENLEMLSHAGFEAEDFGQGMIIVHECPMEISADEVKDVVSELAGYLVENRHKLISEKSEWLFSLMACKAAIKAGYNTTDYEREQFIKSLFEHPEIRYCPHGRPVMIEMTRRDLEKSFGRA